MIVSALQENLAKALTQTNRLVSTKPQLPILQNVLLSTRGGEFTICATNLETSEAVAVRGKVEKEGGICVPSRLFTDLVLTLPQNTVRLLVKDEGLVVVCGATSATVAAIAATEFPPISKNKKTSTTKIDKNALANALGRVLFAAATDDGRPLLAGVKITKKEGAVQMAATDGYRLSLVDVGVSIKANLNVVIPARALWEVLKVCAEEKEAAELVVSEAEDGQMSFSIGETEIITRVVDGEYPGYEKIIPTTHTTRVLFEREELVRAIKSASIFARDSANIVRFLIDGQRVEIMAKSPQAGENRVGLGAKVDGEGGEISFNSRFLLDFFTNFTEKEVLFEMTGSLNPGVFRPVKDGSFLHVIMPVRTTPG